MGQLDVSDSTVVCDFRGNIVNTNGWADEDFAAHERSNDLNLSRIKTQASRDVLDLTGTIDPKSVSERVASLIENTR